MTNVKRKQRKETKNRATKNSYQMNTQTIVNDFWVL